MSPRESLTTKVLPSRIWTRPRSSIVLLDGDPARPVAPGGRGRGAGTRRAAAGLPSTPTRPRSKAASGVLLTCDDLVRRGLRRMRATQSALAFALRHRDVALLDRHEPAGFLLTVRKLEAHACRSLSPATARGRGYQAPRRTLWLRPSVGLLSSPLHRTDSPPRDASPGPHEGSRRLDDACRSRPETKLRVARETPMCR